MLRQGYMCTLHPEAGLGTCLLTACPLCCLQADGLSNDSANKAASRLVKSASAKHSQDNITAIVMIFKWGS